MKTCWKCLLPIEPHGNGWVLVESVDPDSNPCYAHHPEWIAVDWFIRSDQDPEEVWEEMNQCRVRAAKCLADR